MLDFFSNVLSYEEWHYLYKLQSWKFTFVQLNVRLMSFNGSKWGQVKVCMCVFVWSVYVEFPGCPDHKGILLAFSE